jgi:hypothetical protein
MLCVNFVNDSYDASQMQSLYSNKWDDVIMNIV